MHALTLPALSTQGGDSPTLKGFRGGTHRLHAPEKTVARLQGLLPLLGITRIANVTGLDSIGIPVVMVCRPNSRALAVSQGKGPTLAAAKASGLMESIESYHAERIQLPLKMASFNELRFSHPLVDLNVLPRPTGSRFHPNERMLWIEGTELLTGEPRWVPYESVHQDFRIPAPPGSGCFFMSSNGLASGNHLLEAVSHGICEVVERDASSLWFARSDEGRRACRLDLSTVDDPGCREILDRYDRAGVAVAVWETTSDIGLASFDCMIVEKDLSPVRPLPSAFGAGCHPAREVALMRSLTEAAQSRLTSISGSRDDMDRPGHERAHQQDILRALHSLIVEEVAGRSFLEVPTRVSSSFDEDLLHELRLLESAGIREVVALDLTRAELEIPIAKVVIPGLETCHRLSGYVRGPRARRVVESPAP